MKLRNNTLLPVTFFVIIFSVCAAYGQLQIALESKIISTESVVNAEFGLEVAIDGDTAVIGVPMERVARQIQRGAVYVFVKRNGVWINQAKLLAADGYQRQQFGRRIAISGNTLVVGAPLTDVNGVKDQGAIYIFERSGDNWEKQVKKLAADGGKAHGLGMSVGISGDTIIAGAPGEYMARDGKPVSAIGAAYVFTRIGDNWSEKAKLKEQGDKKGLFFGNQVAIDDKMAVITSATDALSPDYVCVFSDGGTGWKQEERVPVKGSIGEKALAFGLLRNIALDGNTFVIGGVYTGPEPASAVHVFVRDRDGWKEQAQLVEPEQPKVPPFGWGVDISGNLLVVGSPWNGGSQGAVFVYERFLDRGNWVWRLQNKVTAPDGKILDLFGTAVAISGNTIITGSPGSDIKKIKRDEGAAYVFDAGGAIPAVAGAASRAGARKIRLKLDSETNGYRVLNENGKKYVQGENVIDPLTGLSLRGALKLMVKCPELTYVISDDVMWIDGKSEKLEANCKEVFLVDVEIPQ